MNVLVVGGGSREHALCWRLAGSQGVDRLYCAPGNAGIAELATNLAIGAEDIDGLVSAARARRIDLVVVGPEAPLAAGLVDRLAEEGIAAFGPTAAAARIEASKVWTKTLLGRIGVPTARAECAASVGEARRRLAGFGYPLVLKADGLAAGKGVTTVHDALQAERLLDDLFVARSLGEAADRILIEEYLQGRELSVLAFCDGERLALMPPARDYKAAFDGDRGPNTGGMGAYSRPAFATAELIERVRAEILEPVVEALAEDGCPFVGVLYAGLMVTSDGPKVLEFNSRFGDPEAQVILPLLDFDLLEVLQATAEGRLGESQVDWQAGNACGVVLASAGYPGSYETGRRIEGLDVAAAGGLLFHGGTDKSDDGSVVTAGGRVLTAVGRGSDLAEARAQAYTAATAIRFEGRTMRTDIAADELLVGARSPRPGRGHPAPTAYRLLPTAHSS